jgi:hypothetical protein
MRSVSIFVFLLQSVESFFEIVDLADLSAWRASFLFTLFVSAIGLYAPLYPHAVPTPVSFSGVVSLAPGLAENQPFKRSWRSIPYGRSFNCDLNENV